MIKWMQILIVIHLFT